MTDSIKKISTEAEDVFEFLDSLPQSSNDVVDKDSSNDRDSIGQGTHMDKNGKSENKEDILEFLEELEKSTKKKNTTNNNNIEKSSKENKTSDENSSIKESVKNEEEEEEDNNNNNTQVEGREDSPLNDPITSFTNWWSKSGSDKVSRIWNKTQEQASQFKDKLIEKDTMVNLSNLKNNLNTNNLLNLTDQITKNLTKIVVGDTEEVLRIHLVHDLINLSYLQYYVEEKFDRVMSSQVEGGIRIFVDEWGKPNNNTNNSSDNDDDDMSNDESRQKIDLNLFQGKENDGDKLAFANLDNSIKLFNKAHETLLKQQQNDQKANNNNSSSNNISDIFISILPISVPSSNNVKDDDDDEVIKTIDTTSPNNFHFTVVLKDVSNDITCIARSQSFPLKWLHWLQGSKIQNVDVKKDNLENKGGNDEDDEIAIDPSEWVQQWIEDGIALVIGVVAQNYVIERMGF